MLTEKKLVTEEKLYEADCDDVSFDENNNAGSADEYESEPELIRPADHIPLDCKRSMINIAKQRPNWSLRTLQKKGYSLLKRKENIKKSGKQTSKVEVRQLTTVHLSILGHMTSIY